MEIYDVVKKLIGGIDPVGVDLWQKETTAYQYVRENINEKLR